MRTLGGPVDRLEQGSPTPRRGGRDARSRRLGKARQHLQGFLLRHGRHYAGRTAWTLAYRRWLTTLRFPHPAQQIVLQDYIHAVQDAEQRVALLAEQITALLPSWSLAPVVQALQAMRGVGRIVAVSGGRQVGELPPLRQPASAHGLSRPGAERALERQARCGAAELPKTGKCARPGAC